MQNNSQGCEEGVADLIIGQLFSRYIEQQSFLRSPLAGRSTLGVTCMWALNRVHPFIFNHQSHLHIAVSSLMINTLVPAYSIIVIFLSSYSPMSYMSSIMLHCHDSSPILPHCEVM